MVVKKAFRMSLSVVVVIGAALATASQALAREAASALSKGGIRVTNFKLTSSSYTVESWVKPASLNAEIELFDQFAGSPNSDWRVAVMPGGRIGAFTRGFVSSNWMYSNAIAPLNRWTHVAVSCDGDTVRIFLNGRLDSAHQRTSAAAIVPTASGIFHVAGRKDPMPFNGLMTECRVWSSVRTETEIATNMWNRLTGEEAGLAAYWPLDEGSGTLVSEKVAGYESTLSSDAAWLAVLTPFSPRVPATAGSLVHRPYASSKADDGVVRFDCSSFASTGFNLRSAVYTLEAWVNLKTSLAPELDLFRQFKGSTTGDFMVSVRGTKLNVFSRGFATGNWMPSTGDLSVYRWSHVAVVSNGLTIKLYIDGKLDASYDRRDSSDYTPPMSEPLYVCGGTDTTCFNGHVSDVRIWDVARGPEEIAANMRTRLTGTEYGLIAYLPFDDGSGGIARNLARAAVTDGTIGGAAGWTQTLNPFQPRSTDTDLHHVWATGDLDTGVRFNTVAYSWEAWVWPSDIDSENEVLTQYAGGSANDIMLNLQSDGRVGTFARNFAGSAYAFSEQGTIPARCWSHLAVTCDGDLITTYVNGRAIGTMARTASGRLVPTQAQSIVIGGMKDAPIRAFRGRLSDVRLWSCVRSAEEIAANYKTRLTGWEPGLLGYYPLNQTRGTTAWNFSNYGIADAQKDVESGCWKRIGTTPFGDRLGFLLYFR